MSEISREEKKATITPGQDLVSGHVQSFKNELTQLINDGVKDMVIDLSNVEMLDSFGIGVILYTFKNLRKNSGSLKIVKASDDILHMFTLISLDKHFAVSGRN